MSKARLPSAEECRQMRRVCACFNLRRAARQMTQHFNAKFEASGLNATQFVILAVLQATGPLGLTALAQQVALDPSTMTRNLAVLRRRGWVTVVRGDDRRVRHAVLTAKGKTRLASAYPAWIEAQASVSDPFGDKRYRSVLESLAELTRPARSSGADGNGGSAKRGQLSA
jgi:DNA-binding MarR family transcriptional regulator